MRLLAMGAIVALVSSSAVAQPKYAAGATTFNDPQHFPWTMG